MKKKIILLTISLLAIILAFTGCSKAEATKVGANSLEAIKSKGTIILGLDDSFPPMGFRGENGDVVGFDIDVAREVASQIGVELVIKPIDWDAKMLELNNKNIDLIWNGLTITEERKKQVGFSKPYLSNTQAIIVQGNSPISKKSELANSTIGVQMASSGEDALMADEISKKSKEIKKYGKYTEALLDLKAGRTEAVVMDEVVARYYLSKKPGEYKVLTDNFGKEEYGIGFRKDDTEFINEVDKILYKLQNDGTLDKIASKWFGNSDILK